MHTGPKSEVRNSIYVVMHSKHKISCFTNW